MLHKSKLREFYHSRVFSSSVIYSFVTYLFATCFSSMLRRDIRLRRDYLYRKSLEGKKKEEYEKKMKVREALASSFSCCSSLSVAGKKVPTELRYEAEKLKHTVDMEDEETKELKVCFLPIFHF